MLHIQSALFYGSMSTLMVFANKYVLTNLDFNFPIFLIMAEMILNVIVLLALNNTVFNKYRDFKIDTSTLTSFVRNPLAYRYNYLVVIFCCLHAVLSLKALNGLNIPMYVMFKRCTPLLNLILSIFVFKAMSVRSWHNQKIILSVVFLVIGVIIASIGDVDLDIRSTVICGFSVICQASYFACIQKCGENDSSSKNNSSLQTLFECSFFSVPMLVFFLFLTGEHLEIRTSISAYFFAMVSILVVCGSLLCFSQFWCTITNNALTTAIIGSIKVIIQTIFGIFFFNSLSDFSTLTLIGFAINTVSALWYTYLKHVEHNVEKKTLPVSGSPS